MVQFIWLACARQRNDFIVYESKRCNMVCPPLHHSSEVRHPLRRVVSASHFVSFYVCKLAFNPISVEQVAFVQDRGSHGPKTVRRGAAMISHSVECIEHGVAGHALAFSRRWTSYDLVIAGFGIVAAALLLVAGELYLDMRSSLRRPFRIDTPPHRDSA
jgi:hypothetical protein